MNPGDLMPWQFPLNQNAKPHDQTPAAEENIKTSGQWDKLSAEQQRLVEKMVCTRILYHLFFPLDLFVTRSLGLRWHSIWSCFTRGKEE